jgi:hypothetical protein
MELDQLDVHIDGFTKLRLSLFEGAELYNLPRLAACAARWTVEMAHCRIIHNRPRLEEIQDGKADPPHLGWNRVTIGGIGPASLNLPEPCHASNEQIVRREEVAASWRDRWHLKK